MLAAIFPIVVCATLAYPTFKIFSVKGISSYLRCSAIRVVQQACLSGLFILFLLLSTIIYLLFRICLISTHSNAITLLIYGLCLYKAMTTLVVIRLPESRYTREGEVTERKVVTQSN